MARQVALARRISWLPVVTLAVLGGIAVGAVGRVGPDWPAQEFRAWLASHAGVGAWNDAWYSGHALPGYSVLYPPVSALFGATITGILAATLCAWGAVRLATTHAAYRRRVTFAVAATATACVLDSLIIGQIPFLLGAAAGVHAVVAVKLRQPLLALSLATACSLSSPLAGLFLAIVGLAWLPELRWRRAWPFAGSMLGSVVAAVLGGGSGTFPSDVYTVASMIAFVTLGLIVVPRRHATIRRAVLVYGFVAAILIVVPNPVGGNIDRLGRLVAIPLALWVIASLDRGQRRRRWAIITVTVSAALLWHLYPVVSAVERADDDPSNTARYYAGLLNFLATQDPTRGRLEIPFTREHWESSFVAPHFPLARGWERQLDLAYNDVLYHPLSAASYKAWLDASAVDLVAVPGAPLDYGGAAEGVLLRHAPNYLRVVYRDENWTVYQVASPAPLINGDRATLDQIGPSSVAVRFTEPGTTTIKVHDSPLWQTNSPTACLEPSTDGWLHVHDSRPELVTITASVTMSSILHRAGPYCST
ncbi:MAG TPA: hypothetical protein VHO01_16535 [Jatrophihabitans sp.]|nr:hypothetical protein [Jatrophihabitans sp.]